VLQILPSRYPVVALAAVVAFFEDWQGLVKVFVVDVVEDLPQHLAVLELVPRIYTTGQVKGIHLTGASQFELKSARRWRATHPVEQSS
jgi:hypothetical protein